MVKNSTDINFILQKGSKGQRVAMRAREMQPKIVKIIDFWKGLLKQKKPGKLKIGADTSFV